MRRAIGPIVTTGVAIVVAGVVVANPVVVAPQSEVRIPAVKLSGSSDASGGMLDQAFLDAIAPGPAASTNPFSVLKQLFSSLAADATSLGKNALVNAFVAGVTAVSEPELTASTLPYVSDGLFGPAAAAPPPDFAGIAAAAQAAGIDPAAIANGVLNGTANITSAVDPTHLTNTIGNAVGELASSVASDAGYVGHELIAAAFAAGAVVASEPEMIVAALQSLVKGDIKGALQTAVAAATAPLGPTSMVINAFFNVVQSHLSEITIGVPTIDIPSETPSTLSAANPLASAAGPASPLAGISDRGVRASVTVTPVVTPAAEQDAPSVTTADKPAESVDPSAIARLAAPTAQDARADSAEETVPAPALRTTARDAKQGRDAARGTAGTAGRGARGAAGTQSAD